VIVESGSSEFKNLAYSNLKDLNTSNLDVDRRNTAEKLYKDYFAAIDPIDAVAILYEGLLKETDEDFIKMLVTVIRQNDLVDYGYIHKLLDSNLKARKSALSILQSDKPSYTYSDIDELQKIIGHIDISFPSLAAAGIKKGFLSSAEKEVWICNCSKSNSLDSTYCTNCGNDQFGFNIDEAKPKQYVVMLTNKLTALTSLL
jgi:hypothetical protein